MARRKQRVIPAVGDEPRRAEDDLADAIASAWGELEASAAKEDNAEKRKSEALILEWAGKLAAILRGKTG